MQMVIRIIAILIVLEGILFLLKPQVLKKIMDFFSRGKRLYIAAVLRLSLGTVFLLAASRCKIDWVIIILGILFLVSGIAMFTIKLDRQKAMISWWQRKSTAVLRIVALVAVALGAVIIYSA